MVTRSYFRCHRESALVHIGAASARRSGPTFAVELSRFFEVGWTWPMQLAAWRRVLSLAIPIGHPRDQAHSSEECLSPWVRLKGASTQRPSSLFQSYRRRRDRDRTDPRQLCQLRWRSARSGGFWWSSVIHVDPAYRARFVVNSDSILC